MNFNVLHPADQLVMMMERIYSFGMTTTSGGNLSIKDSDGNIWITPGSIDKGSLKRRDICCVHPDGQVEGIHAPSVELPFHKSLYDKRPDIRAIVHAHPAALVAFSIVRQLPKTSMVASMKLVCGELRMAKYELPGSEQLGENIADQFEEGIHAVLLENHGVVIGESDLFRAFMIFETLDFSARLQINATCLNNPVQTLTTGDIYRYKSIANVPLEEFETEEYSSLNRAARRDMCTFILRAYEQQLFTSTQGTFSVRLDEDSFVITPYGKDRKYLQPEDLVTIRDGKREHGKTPSRAVRLHQAIYLANPEINSIIIAHPPNIMAFAVTGEEFDARLIPESYIMLKDILRIPFCEDLLDPDKVAAQISMKHPASIVDNDCVITVGTSLLKAFDRLEVMEFSAKSVIAAAKLGPIVKINARQVKEIEQAFHL